MTARLFRILKRVLVLLIVVAATLLVARAWDSQRGPDLEPWHTYVPHDLHADQIDDDARVPGNRYFERSPIYPGRFAQDWNRSYILEPDWPPVGAVVLLH